MSEAEKRNVYNISKCYGNQIRIFNGDESNLLRDEYGSIIRLAQNYETLYSFPIEFSPSQKILEKTGITEKVDVIFYLSKYECDLKGISYDSLDTIRQVVGFEGVEYKIKSKNRLSQFGADFLYIVIGCVKN